jgi:hypothetical protein
MPAKNQHLNKAQHDEDFAASLDVDTTPYLDWIITGLFYSALHYVEAYFATLRVHSPDHRTRDSSICRDHKLRAIFADFSELKNFSINARYYDCRFEPRDVSRNLRPRLERVKTHILRLLE